VILAADPHASIAIGTHKVLTKDQLRAAAEDGSIEQVVDWKPMKKDDFYYTPAGTVHAIGPGLTVVEIQQNVDLTYRLYDYGSARELHLDAGIAASEPIPYVATFKPHDIAPGRILLSDGPKIVIERWKSAAKGTLRSDGRPLWLVPLAGKATIGDEALEAGGAWLAEGETPITLEDDIDLLVAYPGTGAIAELIA
jgi:mannose-6-phosphate isomerase